MAALTSALCGALRTPAFVYDEEALEARCARWERVQEEHGIRQLFPMKSHTLEGPLRIIGRHVDGFAASSLFEATFASEIRGDGALIHFTSPGLRPDELERLVALCDAISFNSMPQWLAGKALAQHRVQCGLRVNPQLSFVDDERYDPCRPQSRLGAPLDDVRRVLRDEPGSLAGIEGLHFHSNCGSADWSPLLQTVQHLDRSIPSLLTQCRWINLGGGYLLGDDTDLSPFGQAVALLQSRYGLEVYIEPGAGVMHDTCLVVAEVLDIFDAEGARVAILNTSVNHIPEVFDCQHVPEAQGAVADGDYRYLLGGMTCLSGDIFGSYAFASPLSVGSRVVFTDMGAYTLVKGHMFNGVALPAIYRLSPTGALELRQHCDYAQFRARWADAAAPGHEVAADAGAAIPRLRRVGRR